MYRTTSAWVGAYQKVSVRASSSRIAFGETKFSQFVVRRHSISEKRSAKFLTWKRRTQLFRQINCLFEILFRNLQISFNQGERSERRCGAPAVTNVVDGAAFPGMVVEALGTFFLFVVRR